MKGVMSAGVVVPGVLGAVNGTRHLSGWRAGDMAGRSGCCLFVSNRYVDRPEPGRCCLPDLVKHPELTVLQETLVRSVT